ncbi:MAG: hypothetical protein JST00_19830 [Deltaproteobacteria bacterium]|nr:hypothetical protein [Deltaproteobacteria bacterium]
MADWEDDPDAPPTPEEVAASQRLRDALETGTDVPDLALSLRAAWSPEPISARDHQEIVDAVPSSSELAAAEALRLALETGEATDDSHALLAIALKNAYAPAELDGEAHRAIVDTALAKMAGPAEAPEVGKVVEIAARRRGNVVRIAFGVATGALALAASIVLVLGWQGSHGPSSGGVALARVRTTQPLFSEPFKTGETSARIDRIASARASDLRDNRFAKWGVR